VRNGMNTNRLKAGTVVFLILACSPMVLSDTSYEWFQSPGISPHGMTWDGEYLWNVDFTSHKIYRMTRDIQVLQELFSPAAFPSGLAFDGEYLWHGDAAGEIYQLDINGELINNFAVDDNVPDGLTFDGTHLWMVDGNRKRICKMTQTMEIISSFSSPGRHPTGLAWNGNDLVHSDTDYDWIYLLNRETGQIVGGGESPGEEARGLTWDGSHLWHADLGGEGGIYKITELSSDLSCRIVMVPSEIHPGDIVYADAVIWNPSNDPLPPLPLFVILEVYGQYFFAPAFNDFDFYELGIGSWQTVIPILPIFKWPEGAGSGSATWYVAMTNEEMTEIYGGISTFTFTWLE